MKGGANKMTREEFCTRAELLFGGGWQSRIAREVGVNPRTVRRWVSGESAVPVRVRAVLAARFEIISKGGSK